MRGAWICSVDENDPLNSANFRLQKRSSRFFNKRFSAEMIKSLNRLWTFSFLVLLWPFCSCAQCAADWPLIFYGFVDGPVQGPVVHPQIWNTTKIGTEHRHHPSVLALAANGAEPEWEKWKIHLDIAWLCGVKQTAKHKAYKLYTCFKFLVTACWRNIAKYISFREYNPWML